MIVLNTCLMVMLLQLPAGTELGNSLLLKSEVEPQNLKHYDYSYFALKSGKFKFSKFIMEKF